MDKKPHSMWTRPTIRGYPPENLRKNKELVDYREVL
jgi:hypothetical protein